MSINRSSNTPNLTYFRKFFIDEKMGDVGIIVLYLWERARKKPKIGADRRVRVLLNKMELVSVKLEIILLVRRAAKKE